MAFKERLLKLREERVISRKELSEAIHVSNSTVAKWELGETSPTIDNVKYLCEFFGISADYFISDGPLETSQPQAEREAQETQPGQTAQKAVISISKKSLIISIAAIAAAIAAAVSILLLNGRGDDKEIYSTDEMEYTDGDDYSTGSFTIN